MGRACNRVSWSAPGPSDVGWPAKKRLDAQQRLVEPLQISGAQQRRLEVPVPAFAGLPIEHLARRPFQDPVVRVDQPVDQVATWTRDRFHDRNVSAGIARIAPKRHARAILVDHRLDQHRHPAVQRIEPQLAPVEQGRV
jgi:hypothetical protein